MTSYKYTRVLLFIFIFALGFFSNRLLFDTANKERDASIVATGDLPQSHQLEHSEGLIEIDSCVRKNDLGNSHNSGLSFFKMSNNSCNAACATAVLNDLYDVRLEAGFGDIEKFTAVNGDISAMLVMDNHRLMEFERNLMEVLTNSNDQLNPKKEILLSIASLLPKQQRSELAWTIAHSHQSPEMNRVVLDLAPDDSELQNHVANTSIQTILSQGASRVSAESFAVIQSIVSRRGGDLSSPLEADLAYLYRESESQFVQDASLNLLTQIAPSSGIIRKTLWERLDAGSQNAVHALDMIAKNQGSQKNGWSLNAAEKQRINALADNPLTPVEVRIASLNVLLAMGELK
jgi:hypothetical protein